MGSWEYRESVSRKIPSPLPADISSPQDRFLHLQGEMGTTIPPEHDNLVVCARAEYDFVAK